MRLTVLAFVLMAFQGTAVWGQSCFPPGEPPPPVTPPLPPTLEQIFTAKLAIASAQYAENLSDITDLLADIQSWQQADANQRARYAAVEANIPAAVKAQCQAEFTSRPNFVTLARRLNNDITTFPIGKEGEDILDAVSAGLAGHFEDGIWYLNEATANGAVCITVLGEVDQALIGLENGFCWMEFVLAEYE